ncbi:MAG: hypothetical protein JW827_04835 [Spirochaetes bacterium]|nr:hypothetical protein [Spirochaetota bacterium]
MIKSKVIIITVLFLFSHILHAQTDEEFLRNVQKQSFWFFWNEVNPSTGVIKDRAANVLYEEDGYTLGSIASVGFGLTAICVGHSQGWITYQEAYDRIYTTLNFFLNSASRKNGFYAHFININTGLNVGSEVSSIDTTILSAGALFAGQYFKGTDIEDMAKQLYEGIDWYWMCNGNDPFLNMGWSSGGGFDVNEWDDFNEGFLLDILAVGSPTHPPYNSPTCWTSMNKPVGTSGSYTFIYSPVNNALFVHQFPQCWVDLRNYSWKGINFYTNSIKATLANKEYCEVTLSYPVNYWGLTACDAPPHIPSGYKNYGPGPTIPNPDGTIGVYGPGASVMFTPTESIAALKYIYNNYYSQMWGKYGFMDAMNIYSNWYDDEVIGIDQGSMLLSIENYFTGMVWDEFMKIEYIQNALNTMEFTPDTDVTRPQPVVDFFVIGNRLEWTAPSDNTGTVKKYYIRYLTRAITKPADWYEATELTHEIAPKTPGEKETLMVEGIPPGTYFFAIKSEDNAGNKSLLSNPTVSAEINPIKNTLLQNFPNPFHLKNHDHITLRYVVGKTGSVKLTACSLGGKIVKQWDKGSQAAGYYQFDWDGKDSSGSAIEPGIYILILEIGGKKISENSIVVIQ